MNYSFDLKCHLLKFQPLENNQILIESKFKNSLTRDSEQIIFGPILKGSNSAST